MLPEGEYKGFDGFTKQSSTRWGLDTNRQYPAGWEPGESSGPHPLFVRAFSLSSTSDCSLCKSFLTI